MDKEVSRHSGQEAVLTERENRKGCVSCSLLNQTGNKRSGAQTFRKASLREKAGEIARISNTWLLSFLSGTGTTLSPKSRVVNRHTCPYIYADT